jgi:Flp pilus assembly protein protease CpaA
MNYLIAGYAFATAVLGGFLALSLVQLRRLTQKKR